MQTNKATELSPEQIEALIERAKMSILFNYEIIAGQNLYGAFPDRSVWNTLNYKKAASTAIQNAEQYGRPLIAQIIREYLL